ncbi:hypothetical protein Tco_0853678, partial [Tanacetum coccineum]
INEAVKAAVQLQSDRLRSEAQADNEDFINKIDENMKKIIKEQTSHAIAANLSELELKKILIDKIENNKRRDDKNEDEEPSTGSNRGSKRRRAGKEPESTSAPKETNLIKSLLASLLKQRNQYTPMKTWKNPAHQEFDIGFTED